MPWVLTTVALSALAGGSGAKFPTPQDTARPAIPSAFVPPADSSRLVRSLVDTSTRYYRDVFEIRFQRGASGPSVRAVLYRYGATIIGGRPDRQSYVVRIPDPGTEDAWDATIANLGRDAAVANVLPVLFRAGPGVIAPSGQVSITENDTAVPPIPEGPFPFAYDTTKLVSSGSVYQRDVFTVAFRPGTSGVIIRAFFARFGATVIGGASRTGGYMVRIPDPVTRAAWESVGRAMGSHPSVSYAVPLMYRFGGAIRVNRR